MAKTWNHLYVGDQVMKISWTLSVAAVALVMGVFPAFAYQGQMKAKSSEQKKLEKKVDAATLTPFMTPHQGNTLKKAVNGGEQMKQDEQLAYPNVAPGMNPMTPKGPEGQPAAVGSQPSPGENPHPEQKPEPPKENPKPNFHLVGTVCGKGADLAVFDLGGEWPAMMKAGEKLEDGTLIISVERGRVCLERVTMAAVPAVKAQEAEYAEDGTEVRAAVAERKAQPEKRERYTVYAW